MDKNNKEQDLLNIDLDNAEFQTLYNLIQNTNQSVFLTGKAGCGKSTFLKFICQNIRKKFVVLAPTGVAAINVDGVTIHSFFKLPFRPVLPEDENLSLENGKIFEFFKYTKEQRALLKNVELIIIDEISMVRADTIDVIDRLLRVFSKNIKVPFGGKQLLFVGDIFQLEPVVTRDSKDILTKFYPNPFFFSANVFKKIDLVPIELKKVYRQSDTEFIYILDRIRINRATDSDLRFINSRYENMAIGGKEFSMTLATKKDKVNAINAAHLSKIDNKEFTFHGEIKGDFPESSLPTEKELILKVGAQIIFIKNDYQKRWVNGTIAQIHEISQDGLKIRFENGDIFKVEPESWRNIKYSYNEKEKRIEETELGVFMQYPIRLAWAITIHKSQGLTFNNVIIDLEGGAFSGGQTYVALSRATSLEAITLKQPVRQSDIFINSDIVKFSHSFNDSKIIEGALKQANTIKYYQETVKDYNNGDFESMLDNFFKAIHSKYIIEQPLIKRYIRNKLNIINTLKNKIKELKKELSQQRELLNDLAKEYYLMGNECVTKANDLNAALRNFDKALLLNPKYADAMVRKGVTLYDMDKLYESMLCLNKAVSLSPLNFKALYNRGKVNARLDNHDAALNDFLRAMAIKPENITLHNRIADSYKTLGNHDLCNKHRLIAEKLRNNRKSDQ